MLSQLCYSKSEEFSLYSYCTLQHISQLHTFQLFYSNFLANKLLEAISKSIILFHYKNEIIAHRSKEGQQ